MKCARRLVVVPLVVLLVAAACGGGTRKGSGALAPGSPGKGAPKGLSQAFVVNQSCYSLVPVAGGLFGACSPSTHLGGGLGDPQLISEIGESTLLPPTVKIDPPWTSTPSGDLVAVGTVKPTDPLAAKGELQAQLLLLQPGSGTVKTSVPLGLAAGEEARVGGISGSTVVLSVHGSDTERLVAYDVSGPKRWDERTQYSGTRSNVQVAGGTVIASGDDVTGGGDMKYVTARRVSDGSLMWTQRRPSGLPRLGDGYPPAASVGRTVFYDEAGAAWSIATGASAGIGGHRGGEDFIARLLLGNSAVIDDDIILSSPLRRVTPTGTEVWSIPGTTGFPAVSGHTLMVLGDGALVALDPSSGRRLAQAPASGDTVQVIGSLAIVGDVAPGHPSTAYRIGDL